MGVTEIIFGIILLVFAVGIILIVLSQQGEQRNNGGVMTGGSSDTYISRNSGRTIDAFLARWTRIFAIGFFICVILVNIMIFFFGSVQHADAIVEDTADTEATVSAVVGDTAEETEGILAVESTVEAVESTVA